MGAGFGGAVSALRLSQAGRSVCVLERGRNFRDQDRPFPEAKEDYPKLLWTDTQDGHIDVRLYKDIAVVVGSGLGGGSLVYANVHYRPDEEIFTEGGWPGEVRNRQVLEPYYARVADMLKIVLATKDLPKMRAMEEATRAEGSGVQMQVHARGSCPDSVDQDDAFAIGFIALNIGATLLRLHQSLRLSKSFPFAEGVLSPVVPLATLSMV